MKKKQLLVLLPAALVLSGCQNGDNNQNTNTNNTDVTLPSGTSGVNPNGDTTSTSVRPPVINKNDLESALQKDYTNMTVAYAIGSNGFGTEYGYEYYFGNHDFVAVFDGNTAEMYGSSYAWMYYSMYEGVSYAWWDASYYVTKGWVSNGSKGIGVGIDYAYFYMPYFIDSIDNDDVDFVLDRYVVKEESIDKVLEGLKFTYLTNDITYVEVIVNSDGYISRIRGFDDPNNDEIGFELQLSSFGQTTYPMSSSDLPPEISPSTIKTYEEMIGHPEEPDVYLSEISININEEHESDDTYGLILDPDDTIDLSFSYLPENANKKEVSWHSTNPEVAKFDVFQNATSGHKYLTALNEGDTEIYVTHLNGDKETVSSSKIKVHVNAPKSIEVSEKDVYNFVITGSENDGNAYTFEAENTIENDAPFTISSWLVDSRSARYGDHKFNEDLTLLCADPISSAHMNDKANGKEGSELYFDFDNQQVSEISFEYSLIFSAHKSYLDRVGDILIETSNDGENWTTIDISEEMKGEFEKASISNGMSPKIVNKSFAPASMVKLVFKNKNSVGNSFAIGMANFTFSANEECHNYNDLEGAPTSIEISSIRNKLKIGSSMKFGSVVLPENATNKNIRWVSSNPDVVKIDAKSGLATALEVGEAKIHAYSVANKEVVSNEITIETYLQEVIPDDENLLIGNTFVAQNVESGVNKFDVKFEIKDNVNADLTLSINVAGQKFDSLYAFKFDSYDENTKVYEFLANDNGVLSLTISEDKEDVEVKFLPNGSDNYLLGNAASGVRLEKAN